MPLEPVSSIVSRRGLYLAGMLTIAVVAVVIIVGITTRKIANAKLSEWTETQAVPAVAVAAPDTHGRVSTLDLPGRLEAYTQAQMYARVSGYLKEWKIDIGTPVKAGRLLAEIDAPDLDQQIMQATADLASAQANFTLAQATFQRGQTLISSGAISKSDLDTRAADASNKDGLFKSAQANLDRLRVLAQYKQITAPFDGLVTARNTDVGALINAGGGGAPLFVLSDTARLRVYVNVPQSYVPSIRIGTQARMSVPEYPGKSFSATVEASAQAVDVSSGTTRMLLVVDNSSGELLTGDFANVSFELPHPEVAVNVPASALIFDRSGLRGATGDSSNPGVLQTRTIAPDPGKMVKTGPGPAPADRVIESPPDGIAAGDQVRIAGAPGTPAEPETAQ